MATGARRVVAGAAVAVVGAGALTTWLALLPTDQRAVDTAAVAGYAAAHPGTRVGDVVGQGEQDGCAVVSVSAPADPDGIVHLVVQRQGDWWVYLGRSTVDLDGSPLPEVCQPGSDLLRDR